MNYTYNKYDPNKNISSLCMYMFNMQTIKVVFVF